jgi:hypothetical protein
MDPILESLSQIKIKKIQIFVSKKDMVPGFGDRGLWPKVTLSLNDRETTISLRNQFIPKYKGYAINNGIGVDSLFDKIKVTVLRLIGKNKNTMFDRLTQTNELNLTIFTIINKIVSKVKSSIHKKNIVEARKKANRQQILRGIRFDLSEEIRRHKLKYNEIRSYEIAKIWDDLMKEQIIKETHDK